MTQLEQRWLSHENDPRVLESILAGDFVHVVSVGMITKAEHIDYVRRHPFNDTSRHFEDLRVRIYGTVGIVNGIVVAKSASGKLRKSTFTDVFAYRNGKWQAVNAQELPVTSLE
ncbi:MAG TPA: nuclear transport factor 2 family protein [Candidatus Limnocylindrales bacterium]|nr:nuclear transport factor 2 family protein [Candidatus Limnocylindrales bacterium]